MTVQQVYRRKVTPMLRRDGHQLPPGLPRSESKYGHLNMVHLTKDDTFLFNGKGLQHLLIARRENLGKFTHVENA